MKRTQIKIKRTSPQATFEFGEFLGKRLAAGDVVALTGDLGAGKTLLTKGLACGLGISSEHCITSPSYTIVNEYQGGVPLYHFDLYRLERNGDIQDLGYEEYFDGRGVAVIEWAEKMSHLLPEERMEIHISWIGEDIRGLEIIGIGDHYEKIVDEIAQSFQ